MNDTDTIAASSGAAVIPATRDAVRSWMVGYMSDLLTLAPDQIDPTAQFDAYGMDSIEAVVMAGVMEEEFGVVIEPTLLLEYPSIELFSKACATEA